MMKRILLSILLLCTLCFAQVPNQKPMLGEMIERSHPLAQGLVGYWLMNEGAGTYILDHSGQGNHVTSFNATSYWQATLHGPALAGGFDLDDAAVVPHSASQIGMSAITFVVLAKNNQALIASGGSQFMLLKGTTEVAGNYTLYWDQSEDIYFNLMDTSGGDKLCNQTDALTDTNWHLWVGRWDGAEMSVWKDAVKMANTTAFSGTLSTGTTTLKIGGDTAGDSWDGQIAMAAIYRRALDPSEIASLYRDPWQMFRRERADMYVSAEAPSQPQVIIIMTSGLPLLVILTLVGLLARERRKHESQWRTG